MSESLASANSAAERVESILARYREPVIAGMRAALDLPGVEHTRNMRIHLGWEESAAAASGKMLRPALCLLCCEAAGGDDLACAMPAAVAIELLHNFTLIHDDIEDQSDIRHGRETLWRRAGIAQAINAGDGMFAIAQQTLLSLADTDVPPDVVLAASRRLNEACIALCEGQHADISFESRRSVTIAEYEAMVRGKSAGLIAASCSIGATVASAREAVVAGFSRYGLALGLGFQVQDDVLGIWGSPDHTGKPVGDDIRAKKKSYPIVYAMEHLDADGQVELARIFGGSDMPQASVERVMALLDRCRAREAASAVARGHITDAVAALRDIGLDPERRVDLEAIATFAVDRRA